jgi:hypothetical protein
MYARNEKDSDKFRRNFYSKRWRMGLHGIFEKKQERG